MNFQIRNMVLTIKKGSTIFLYLLFIFFYITGFSQKTQRPFIWVTQEDKAQILNKIQTQDWAKSFYTNLKKRVDKDILLYKASPAKFLKKLPFNWSAQRKNKIPPFKTFTNFTGENAAERRIINAYLQIGIDCSVLYYLTEDENYAQCALDILHTYVESILQLTPSTDKGNGGWIYPGDHLREARVFGAQIPIIYDFIAPFINKIKKAYDLGKKRKVNFSIENAQKVFLTYVKLAVEHGQTGSNWSVLESYSLVQNTLALEDLELRKKYLDYYLIKGTNRQDALPDFAKEYKNEGDVYPETSGYSMAVSTFTVPLLYILNNYQSDLKLGKKYYKIPFSLDRWNALRYPNDEIIRFGDGQRTQSVVYNYYDIAFLLGQQDNVLKITNKFGPLITEGIKTGAYDRSKLEQRSDNVTVYRDPLRLLWVNETQQYPYKKYELPRTDQFTHAGIFLQRNLSKTKHPDYGLMSFVGGAHMVHGHASGMDMELYGLGEVLGVDHGRFKYRTDMHENYSRLFAAHNTIIVNGSSQGQGGWVGLRINATELEAMEPMPLKEALSPKYSFTRTNFKDDKGTKAEAIQERTMALIRTSPTTGYYMDVFRSDSKLPNEFHDYLYHNIGDELEFLNKDISLKPDKNRYMANAKKEWRQNGRYRNPGWHFFKNVTSSNAFNEDLHAVFNIKKLKDKNRFMKLYILGNQNREYTKVMAPRTAHAPKPYSALETPTLVIRQKGEAWTNPFAVIYEPTFDENSNNGVQSVTKLENNGVFKGFKVISKVADKLITQYIINQPKDASYTQKTLGIHFTGAFAIITYNENNQLNDVYIGEGISLKMKELTLVAKENTAPKIAAYINFTQKEPKVKATENTAVMLSAD